LHKDILDNGGKGDWKGFTKDAVTAAMPAAGEQPTLYIVGGRGGAGKSWFSKSPDSPFDVSKTMYINNDDFKESLPEYAGWNAGSVHEEAGDIADRAHQRARGAGLNVTFDATLKSTGSIGKLIEQYEKAGYRVEGYFMHTAPQVSAVRAMGRFDHTGRYVPAQYILGSTTNEASFDAMTPHFAKWAVYDNNTGNGPVKVVEKR
jgi:predicted ABC-type ATPase